MWEFPKSDLMHFVNPSILLFPDLPLLILMLLFMFVLLIMLFLCTCVAGVLRGARRLGEVSGSHSGPQCLPQSQRPQQGYPVLRWDRTVPEDCPLCQEGLWRPPGHAKLKSKCILQYLHMRCLCRWATLQTGSSCWGTWCGSVQNRASSSPRCWFRMKNHLLTSHR